MINKSMLCHKNCSVQIAEYCSLNKYINNLNLFIDNLKTFLINLVEMITYLIDNFYYNILFYEDDTV